MASYPIPHWIHAAEPSKYWLQALAAGANIAHQQNSLMMQQQELALRERQLQASLQTQEMENRRAEETLAIQKARAETEAGLQSAKIALMRDQQAVKARQLQAQSAYVQAVASGINPAKAMLQFGPMMGTSASEMGAAFRSLQPRASTPRYYVDKDTKEVLAMTPEGVNVLRKGTTPAQTPTNLRQATDDKGRSIPGLYMTPKGTTVAAPSMESREINAAKTRLAELRLKPNEAAWERYMELGYTDLPAEALKGQSKAQQKESQDLYDRYKTQYDTYQRQIAGVEETPQEAVSEGVKILRVRPKGSDQWTELSTPSQTPQATARVPQTASDMPPTEEEIMRQTLEQRRAEEEQGMAPPEQPTSPQTDESQGPDIDRSAAAWNQTGPADVGPEPGVDTPAVAPQRKQYDTDLQNKLLGIGTGILNIARKAFAPGSTEAQMEYRKQHPAEIPTAPEEPKDREEGETYTVPGWDMVWDGESFWPTDEYDQEETPADESDSDYYSDTPEGDTEDDEEEDPEYAFE